MTREILSYPAAVKNVPASMLPNTTPRTYTPCKKRLSDLKIHEMVILAKIFADKYAGTKKRWKLPQNGETDYVNYKTFCELYAQFTEGS